MLDFENVRIDVVGDVIFDEFTYGHRTRPSAEDMAAYCYTVGREEQLPGSAGCTARCIVALGGQASVFSVTGSGRTAKRLSDMLEKLGIAVHFIRDDDRTTTVKQRLVDAVTGRQVAVIERQTRDPIAAWSEAALMTKLSESKAEIIAVTDNDRGVVTPGLAQQLSAFAAERGKKLIVDARPRSVTWYQEHFPHLYLITPNLHETEIMLGGGSIRTRDDIDAAGRKLQALLNCNVLITMSEEGAKLFPVEGEAEELAYCALNGAPVCVSGAGDTVVATIALCVGAGMSLGAGCEVAMHAAAITVSKEGTAVADHHDLQARLEQIQFSH